MFYVIPLGIEYRRYWDVERIYGPYVDLKAAEEDITRRWWPHHQNLRFLVIEGEMLKVKPPPQEWLDSEKREPGNRDNYRSSMRGMQCKDCGADIGVVEIEDPVWIPTSAGGGGERKYKTVLFCPNCEKRPNPFGGPAYSE